MYKLFCAAAAAAVLLSGCGKAGKTAETTAADTSAAVSVSCAELAAAVYAAAEFPEMNVFSDGDLLYYYDIDSADTDDRYAAEQLINAALSKVVIIKAKEGKTDEIYGKIKEIYDDIKKTTGMYPAQAKSAAGAVYGKDGNLIWLICNADGGKAEEALLSVYKGN